MKLKNKALAVKTTLSSRGTILDLSRPRVMGILNITPDSFYASGRSTSIPVLIEKGIQMIDQGADLLDIGGASSRPGAPLINPDLEKERVLPLVSALRDRLPDAWISIDTYHRSTAQAALDAGASMINDISGAEIDPTLLDLAAERQVPLVISHMQGIPETMQVDPHYEDVMTDLVDFFSKKIYLAREKGIQDLILDPGFGFGKALADNFKLLDRLEQFRILGKPLMVGLSRKSMICKTLKVDPENALNGTTALHMVALLNGASLLRVHDVAEARQTVALYESLLETRDPESMG